ncbi:MAG: ribosome silencing factor [Puniceicoccales bacterium]|jgi:ribosome-associated protein|nr:ribosome silencing factor [Puniceicoccales bacterium]
MPKTPSRPKATSALPKKTRPAKKTAAPKKTPARVKATAPVKKAAKRPVLSGVLEKKSAKKTTRATAPIASAAAPRKKAVIVATAPIAAKTPAKATAPALSDLAKHCLAALEEKKAEELTVLDVRGKSSVTDFFIIATGNSEPHLRALRIAAERALDEAGAHIVGRESQAASGWCVVDAFEVIVHLFLAGKRADYAIERLWK